MKSVKLALLILLLPVSSGLSAGPESTEQGQAFATPVTSAPSMRGNTVNETDVDDTGQDSHFSILLGWAAHLSPYPHPVKLPSVQFKDHEFFVEQACSGHECNVLGWYNDTGIVYLDRRLKTEDSVFTQSLLVHELVHYLQDLSGQFDSNSCEASVAREREAYQVQSDYIMAYGTMPFFSTVHRTCI